MWNYLVTLAGAHLVLCTLVPRYRRTLSAAWQLLRLSCCRRAPAASAARPKRIMRKPPPIPLPRQWTADHSVPPPLPPPPPPPAPGSPEPAPEPEPEPAPEPEPEPEPEPARDRREKCKTLYIDRVPPGTTEPDLIERMSAFGRVVRAHLVGGTAFVTFERREDALVAVEGSAGLEPMRVEWSKPASQQR